MEGVVWRRAGVVRGREERCERWWAEGGHDQVGESGRWQAGGGELEHGGGRRETLSWRWRAGGGELEESGEAERGRLEGGGLEGRCRDLQKISVLQEKKAKKK